MASSFSTVRVFVAVACTVVGLCASTTLDDCPRTIARDKYLKVFGNSCFRFDLSRKSYNAARTTCAREDGTLAMPKDKTINDFIAKQLFEELNTKKLFWIGLDDMRMEQTYRWNDKTKMSYNHFSINEGPLNIRSHNAEDCVVIDPANGIGRWRDTQCYINTRSQGHPFICQYPVLKQLTTHDCPSTLPRDKYLYRFGRSCYLFRRGGGKNMEGANETCVKEGGFLASLKSIRVNKFIQKTMLENLKNTELAWIGLNFIKREKDFKWTDGSPTMLINFEDGKGWTSPAGKIEDCVVFNPTTGKWRDIDCQYKAKHWSYFICEFPVTEPATTTPPSTTTPGKKKLLPVPPTPSIISIVKVIDDQRGG